MCALDITYLAFFVHMKSTSCRFHKAQHVKFLRSLLKLLLSSHPRSSNVICLLILSLIKWHFAQCSNILLNTAYSWGLGRAIC